MRELCRRDRLHCCDLLGQPIEEVAAVSGRAAKMESGRRPPLDSQYFKRMEAIEFAVKFDDGLGTGLADADIVLVGVSRTSKTPLSMYLGYLGYKVANVPIVRGIEPPRELFEIDRAKIVGLTIDAERLSEIRQVRARLMRLSKSAYSELVEIYEELEHAAAIHRQLGCPVVDVSELSIEETAQRVLAARRAAQGRGCERVKEKPPVPRWRWALWWALLAPALVLFYVLFRRSGSASALAAAIRAGSSKQRYATADRSSAPWEDCPDDDTSTTSTTAPAPAGSCWAARAPGSPR